MPDISRPPQPSRLFVSHLERLRSAGRLGPLVDVACGRGRHAVPAVRAGLPLIGLDRSPQFLADLRREAQALGEDVPCIRADLESGPTLPLREGICGAVLVFRYLHRPLCDALAALLAPGGLLLYETFTAAQRDLPYGPNRPEFLLAEGELPGLFPSLEIESYEELESGRPRPDAIARLVARKPIT
ncbi:MAG: class I SAM-dependent methyltransferase [Myxococcota bacterium]|nr:class I SAM-dependent methyltransferase [Myxococcota bacterium]